MGVGDIDNISFKFLDIFFLTVLNINLFLLTSYVTKVYLSFWAYNFLMVIQAQQYL